MCKFTRCLCCYFLYICEKLLDICIMRKKLVKAHVVDESCGIVNVQQLSAMEKANSSVDIYHYHNCYEVVMIRQGHVDGMLGYVLGDIQAGSVLMIGHDLPHGLLNVSDDFDGLLVHIPYGVLPWNVDAIPELAKETAFLHDSRYGYLFQSAGLVGRLSELCQEMEQASGFGKMSCLFRMLHILSQEACTKVLVAQADTARQLSRSIPETAVDKAFRFLYQHFQEDITLDEVAQYASQNPSALCRAFKKKSGYTIFQFLNHLRIEKASQLLQNTDLSVAQIAYQVGYNTFSHFNTQFQHIMKISPNQYRKKTTRRYVPV